MAYGRRRKPQTSYASYIYKVLKQVHPDTGISKQGMYLSNNAITSLFARLSAVTNELVAFSQKATITSREIQTAVRLVFPGELAKHAVSEGTKAVTKYSCSGGGGYSGGRYRSTTRSARAGLQFPVGRIHRFLREGSKFRIGQGAPVYLAAVLEYISAEILELGGNAARDDKKVRITPHHLRMAIGFDEELAALFGGSMVITRQFAVQKRDGDADAAGAGDTGSSSSSKNKKKNKPFRSPAEAAVAALIENGDTRAIEMFTLRSYDDMLNRIKPFVEELVTLGATLAEHKRKRTVQIEDVEMGYKLMTGKPAALAMDVAKNRKALGTTMEGQILVSSSELYQMVTDVAKARLAYLSDRIKSSIDARLAMVELTHRWVLEEDTTVAALAQKIASSGTTHAVYSAFASASASSSSRTSPALAQHLAPIARLLAKANLLPSHQLDAIAEIAQAAQALLLSNNL